MEKRLVACIKTKINLSFVQKLTDMKHVSLESIEKAIDIIDNLDDNGLEQVAEKYASAQPILLAYIMSAALAYENEDLEGLIIYYFCLICESFNQEGIAHRSITDEDLDAFEEPFTEMLDAYFEQDEEDILEDFCDQPMLIQFMAIELSEEDADGTSLDDETATQLFVVTTALITLLDRAIEA